jgi:hypothetical protein
MDLLKQWPVDAVRSTARLQKVLAAMSEQHIGHIDTSVLHGPQIVRAQVRPISGLVRDLRHPTYSAPISERLLGQPQSTAGLLQTLPNMISNFKEAQRSI